MIISTLEKEKIDAEKFKAKIEELKSKSSKERANNYNFCEYKTENSEMLTDHIRTQHYQDKESQHHELPLIFNEYHCFYCRFKIKSQFDLDQLVTPSLVFTCKECRIICNSENQLLWHKITTHGPFANKPT